MNNEKTLKPILELIINGKKFSWEEQYILGRQLKELANLPAGEPLFLDMEAPWEDELILNETRVNLARPGIESFNSREKHPNKIILTIETPKGKWENVAFNRSITINELIKRIIHKFHFADDGNYKLKIKGQNTYLDANLTLEDCGFEDHIVLVFTDLGKGAEV